MTRLAQSGWSPSNPLANNASARYETTSASNGQLRPINFRHLPNVVPLKSQHYLCVVHRVGS